MRRDKAIAKSLAHYNALLRTYRLDAAPLPQIELPGDLCVRPGEPTPAFTFDENAHPRVQGARVVQGLRATAWVASTAEQLVGFRADVDRPDVVLVVAPFLDRLDVEIRWWLDRGVDFVETLPDDVGRWVNG